MGLRFYAEGARLAVLLMSVAACSTSAAPPDRFYRIDVVPTTNAKTRIATNCYEGTILVERFEAAGLAQGRAILYVDEAEPLEVGRHHYHYWSEPPTDLLTTEMVTFLRARGIGTHVVTSRPDVDPEHRITGRLKRFERQLDGDRQAAVVELELSLVEAKTGRVVVAEVYRSVGGPSAGNDVADGIPSFSVAATEAFELFASDLSRSCGR